MTQFLQTLKEVAIFMLGAQVLLYLGPGKKYEKYGKMIVSLLVLAQLAQPLLQFWENTGVDSFTFYLQEYEKQNEAFTDRLEMLEENSDSLVWEGMVQSVEEQLADEALRLGVRVERVAIAGGKLLVEVGALEAGADIGAVSLEKLTEVFSEKLGMTGDSMEVVVNG